MAGLLGCRLTPETALEGVLGGVCFEVSGALFADGLTETAEATPAGRSNLGPVLVPGRVGGPKLSPVLFSVNVFGANLCPILVCVPGTSPNLNPDACDGSNVDRGLSCRGVPVSAVAERPDTDSYSLISHDCSNSNIDVLQYYDITTHHNR